ncbi:hypothetical protein AGMMS50293_03210 [Spirochaetia bacterium]|nr:hypothetical protein AGMMS50293_03210 [Spirochaetia bacterium]
MAERKNFFELLPKLIFDPPEKNSAKIKKEIDEIEKKTLGELQTETDPIRRKKLEELKELLQSDMKTIMDPKNPAYEAEAKAMKDKAVNELKAYIELTLNNAKKTVTKGKINYYRKTYRLSDKTIKDVLTDEGLEPEADKPPKLPALFDNSMMDRINNDLKEVQNYKDTNGINLQNVNSMYQFTAYMNDDLSNGANYDSRSTRELKSILEDIIQKKDLNRRSDNIGHTFNHLCNTGTSQIFNSDENRKKYDNSRSYESLYDLFNKIKKAGETRKTPNFANNCIDEIKKNFPDYDEALSIYNKESGLQAEGEPYEPEEIFITVTCRFCGAEKKYSSVEEAKLAKCPSCSKDKPFYVPCPNCGELVLAVGLRICPFCSFFVAGAVNYDGYYRAAENALDRMDLAEAQKQLGNAKSANPKGSNLASLEQRIKSALAEYEKPLQELRDLISSCKLQEASLKIASIHSKMPKLDISTDEKKVSAGLEDARQKFSSASSAGSVQKAKICLDILSFCVDYKPAVDYMRSTPPEPVPSLEVNPDPETGYFSVSWGRAPDDGVAYTLVRKSGGIPSGVTDGIVLLDNQVILSFSDKSAEPGKPYGYAVFVIRAGTASKGAGMTAVLYRDIDTATLKKDAEENRCRLSWERPKNCFAVKVIRKEGGVPGQNDGTVVASNAGDYHEDKDLVMGKLYGYRLQALYTSGSGTAASQGIAFTVQSQKKAYPIKISGVKNGNSYKLNWGTSQTGFEMRFIALNANTTVEEGRLYSNDSIRSFGKQLGVKKSDAGVIDLEITQKTFFYIAAFISSGDGGLASNTVSINTYSPCEFEGKPLYNEGRKSLSIKLKTPLPENLKYIYYTVQKKTPQGQPSWATIKDVGSMNKITAEAYMREKEINITGITGDGDFYITLISAYVSEGGEVYADPSKKKWSQVVPARINWGIKHGLFKSVELQIEFTASNSVTLLPALALCYGSSYLNSANESGAVKILETPEQQCGSGMTIKKTFSIEKRLTASLPSKCKVNLFILDEDLSDEYRRGLLKGCDDFI